MLHKLHCIFFEVTVEVRSTVLTALFAALISAGAYIAIPIGPVPLTLQSFFILTAGILGGRRIGVSSVVIYLLAGALGLPVFSGGTGSIAHFFGPTGGYLLAAVPSAYITGMLAEWGIRQQGHLTEHKPHLMRGVILKAVMTAAGGLAGTVIIYLIGVPWLKIVLNLEWSSALKAGVFPFLVGDGIKLIAAIALGTTFSDRIYDFLSNGAAHEPA